MASEPTTWVRLLSGAQRGKAVKQGRAEAESNVASGFARYLTLQEVDEAEAGTLADTRVRTGTVIRPGQPPQRVAVEGDGPIDPAAVVAAADQAQAKPLNRMNKAELTAEAKRLGVELEPGDSKKIIAAKIAAAQEGGAKDEPDAPADDDAPDAKPEA